ncbi:ATP-binding cassette domain-containing protein [Flavobacterium daejeonense]|uniref:ATP-binding cassette domain-containing protein n=1 Tax=Flavobacterium daejeonense TaxID=350893 RepID=UPI000478BD1F|nr:ATP-binding cassette domain-containing protein [Flavobacterium daejeonense]
MGNHTLIIDSIIKRFRNNFILSDVYINCKTNDIIGLFGRNGIGKSTLLKIIYGIEDAENKFIKIDQKVLKKGYLNNNYISFLPQDSFLPKYLTVIKIINLYIDFDFKHEFLNDQIINLIIDKKVKNLSGGELRYFEIKLILLSKTKFSFLDEPFMGLSPIYIEKVKKLIQIASANKGIIITDHDYLNVLNIANKLYLIKDGKTILLKNKEDLINFGYLSENRLYS